MGAGLDQQGRLAHLGGLDGSDNAGTCSPENDNVISARMPADRRDGARRDDREQAQNPELNE